jgi:hypothetical protein
MFMITLNRIRPRVTLLLITVCLVIFGFGTLGCSDDDTVIISSPQVSLEDTAWRVVELLDYSLDSNLVRPTKPEHSLLLRFNSDGTLDATTPLNELTGRWSVEGSSISFTLGERTVTEVDDEFLELLIADYSFGTALLEAERYLFRNDGQELALFDSSGTMIVRCEALR